MIELIDNCIQLLLVAVCTVVAVCSAMETPRREEYHVARADRAETLSLTVGHREWLLLGLFTGEYFLGDLYSVLYLSFYGETPPYSLIPDLAWYTSYLFMILLLVSVSERRSIKMESRAQLLIPVFTVSLGVFFIITGGEIIGNIVSVVIMTTAMWLAGGGLHISKIEGNSRKKPFYLMCLVVLALEYALWISSSFWLGDTPVNPYFWFDTLLSVSFVCMVPAVRKAVGE